MLVPLAPSTLAGACVASSAARLWQAPLPFVLLALELQHHRYLVHPRPNTCMGSKSNGCPRQHDLIAVTSQFCGMTTEPRTAKVCFIRDCVRTRSFVSLSFCRTPLELEPPLLSDLLRYAEFLIRTKNMPEECGRRSRSASESACEVIDRAWIQQCFC